MTFQREGSHGEVRTDRVFSEISVKKHLSFQKKLLEYISVREKRIVYVA